MLPAAESPHVGNPTKFSTIRGRRTVPPSSRSPKARGLQGDQALQNRKLHQVQSATRPRAHTRTTRQQGNRAPQCATPQTKQRNYKKKKMAPKVLHWCRQPAPADEPPSSRPAAEPPQSRGGRAATSPTTDPQPTPPAPRTQESGLAASRATPWASAPPKARESPPAKSQASPPQSPKKRKGQDGEPRRPGPGGQQPQEEVGATRE
ncbi:hypothetical protein NDU88_007516 [Pleurodeles waltl]|uniref:Uncharacterized protein n=1 Tax=Pleurodeles waltl TaxID=8319 RepID=A0AAV7N2B7_PLEWA|nr:hypothetical protein NDU88_007516 [Pleurodeles waltl]